MKLNSLWDGLKRIANGDYVLEGNLISDEDVEIDLDDRLVVRGSVISKKRITVRLGIKAGYGIEVGEGIEAGWGIEAGTFIHSEKRIFAGVSIYHTSENCNKTIMCAELRKGEICFGDLVIEPKIFDVVCVEYLRKERNFTIGKVYTWENGGIRGDDGFVYENMADGTDPDKWRLSDYYKFIRIVD